MRIYLVLSEPAYIIHKTNPFAFKILSLDRVLPLPEGVYSLTREHDVVRGGIKSEVSSGSRIAELGHTHTHISDEFAWISDAFKLLDRG